MQHPEARRKAGFRVFSSGVFLLYLDEFGHDGVWDPSDPAHSHHPLFGLTGIAVPGERARDLDRGYLRLKLGFFKFEIERVLRSEGKRPERFEPKQLQNRRDFRFATSVIQLVTSLGGHVFAQGITKEVARRHDEQIYSTIARRLLATFERYLRHRHGTKLGCGVIVMDRRDEIRDLKLLGSVQGHLFSSTGIVFNRICETPLLVRSEWYHGVQAADTVARVAGSVFRHRYTGDTPNKARLEKIAPLLEAAAYQEGEWSTVHVRKPRQPQRAPEASGIRDRAPLSQPVLSAERA